MEGTPKPTVAQNTQPIDVQAEELGPCHHKLTVKVPSARIVEEYDSSYKAAGKNLAIPGFRKGKIPVEMLRTVLGDQVEADAKQQLFEQVVRDAVAQANLVPLRVINFDIDKYEVDEEQDLEFEVEVETAPTVELPDWNEINVIPEPVVIEAEQVEAALQDIRNRSPRFEDAEEGQGLDSEHAVVMDLVYTRDGEDGPDAKDIRLGLDAPLYGVEEDEWTSRMTDAKLGDEIELACAFEEGFSNEDWVGSTGTVKLSIKKMVKPRPATDEEIAEEAELEVEELGSKLKERMQAEAERNERNRQADEMLQQILDKRPFQLAGNMVEEETANAMEQQIEQAVQQGADEDEVRKQVESSRAEFANTADQRLKSYFLIRRIAQQEEIKVTKNEMTQALRSISRHHGVDVKTVEKVYKEQGRLDDVASDILTGKVRAFLMKKIEDKHGSIEGETAEA
ncbi:MAG: trigger factor [Planctomycetes bacterium]|nr:trigger factor [Planctomycetota bacterium]